MRSAGFRITKTSAPWLSVSLCVLECSARRAAQIARAYGFRVPRCGHCTSLPENWLGFAALHHDSGGYWLMLKGA